MNKHPLAERATALLTKPDKYTALTLYHEVITALESGELRVATKTNNGWQTYPWIKEVILLGFKYGELTDFTGNIHNYYDKATLPPQQFKREQQIRLVPGGSTVRCGAFIAPKTIIMPPSYINIGAYIDSDTMIDSHVLVGSCAQIGKKVHLAAGAQIGGVLEPVRATPVIIEDEVFVGGNAGIFEGVIVEQGAVISSGVILNQSTPLYDNIQKRTVPRDKQGRIVVPAGSVVVPGSRPLLDNPDHLQVYCPIIIKYRDDKTENGVKLAQELR